MIARGVVVSVLACLALTGCGESTTSTSREEPLTLPVGPTEWDVSAPAWFYDGTLHVGEWNQSRGPTDEYGTHVLQVAAFDTRTGEQLYRTPDVEPGDGVDLADWCEEGMPRLEGVSNERIFFDGATIDLGDGSAVPAGKDSYGIDVYEGYAETLFPDGYRVSIRGEGRRRELAEPSIVALGRLSPDRSTLFDVPQWPTEAVVYDAKTGQQAAIDAPWAHFILVGWSDDDTFHGVAERIDERNGDNVLRARQVVTCELRTLACTPVSPAMPTEDDDQGQSPTFLVEGSGNQL